jgi:hypothetical protein
VKVIYRYSFLAVILIVLVAVSACATRGSPVEIYVPTVDVSELERDDSEFPTIIYRRTGAPELGAFTRFIIDPVQVFYDDPAMQELSPEQVGEIQQYLLHAMVRELRDAGYEVGTRSEAGTLRISFTLSGLKAPSAGARAAATVRPVAASIGEATVEAIFRDGITNRVEAVVVSRARGFRWLNRTTFSTWVDVQEFIDDWAEGFRISVDEAHAH